MAQLVGPQVGLINTMSNTRLDRAGVKAKFDVFPEQIVDYLALVGDSSDNIPGITGVGPKTAAKWLSQYQTLDELIARAADVGGKVGENLRAGLELLELSRKLATIDTALPLEIDAEELVAGAPDLAAAARTVHAAGIAGAAQGIGSGRVGRRASRAAAAASAIADGGRHGARRARRGREPRRPCRQRATIRRLSSQAALDEWLAKLAAAPLISFATETDSLDYMQARLVGLSFAVAPGEAAYLPVGHDYAGAPEQLDRDKVLAAFKPLLEDPAPPKVGHHQKYDTHILANCGIALRGHRFDSMLESYVLNSVATRHDMDSTAGKISRRQDHCL